MGAFTAILIGNDSLTIACGRALLARGNSISAVITQSGDVRQWATGDGIAVHGYDAPPTQPADWVMSIANLKLLGPDLLGLGTRGALNFHDGPLPRYAGLNAPVWAKLAGERRHGITWHLISGGVDEGDILAQEMFDIRSDDTALTLNTRCFEAGLTSFERVLEALEQGDPGAQVQDLSQRSYFGLADRPDHHGVIDPHGTTREALRIIRALDHGPYWNPLSTAKLMVDGHILHIGEAEVVAHDGAPAPGTILAADADTVDVMLADGALRLRIASGALNVRWIGEVAVRPEVSQEAMRAAAKRDAFWRLRLSEMVPATMPLARAADGAGWASVSLQLPETQAVSALLTLAEQMYGAPCDIALGTQTKEVLLSDWVPLSRADDLAELKDEAPFAADLLVRDIGLRAACVPALGYGARPIPGTCATLTADGLQYDTAQLDAPSATLLAARLEHIAGALAEGQTAPEISPADLAIMDALNPVATPFDDTPLHHQIEAQAAKTPEAIAVVVEDQSLTYADLNTCANRAAHALREMGVKPGTLVGLYVPRSLQMVIGALAILKAGGAYVPLDPGYPASRIEGYLEDSAVPIILTTAQVAGDLPQTDAQLLVLDRNPRLPDAPVHDPEPAAQPGDLAYLIFTSGSTGRPKGVMVEHRNLSNFAAGMDARLAHDPAGTWLAVTSLNFDISVLELIYTLARGFMVVVTSDETRAVLSNGPVMHSAGGMEFSIYYWGNDDGVGPKKYELLLEGAKFADANGFCAVWTPERHFHAFGGPYPNPSVTGAAVAAVTRNIGVRAGSCVAPLHHPARIAEEWAVIDNLTDGRAGMAIASGWQPDDFILRPENTPPQNKPAMMETIETLRKLWRGDAVAFPKADGTEHAVVTQPRPVSKSLPVWVTTAGNPETWKEAGRIGANVLTHLLGQSVDEVAEKITLYHAALREAGHDPKDFTVTLMLHTFLASSREEAREIAREPMKDYLRSAAGLIKQYAWAFPAFKRPKGVDNAFQLDLGSLDEDELEGILDFAFQRYFDDSGLFGTVQDALSRVDALKAIGVNEVACLIDYGIAPDVVMGGLTHLADVLARSNADRAVQDDDHSIAAQLVRHKVTHLQCTPSMARMMCLNDEARGALLGVQHLMIGGEALPGSLVADLQAAAPDATITNMYGPTETTIWSSTQPASAEVATVGLGSPIANTTFHILDEMGAAQPIGMQGELCIGGAGVTRGYLQRDDLTAERFVQTRHGRLYRTGDLARITAAGAVEFLGRIDTQIKLRGYRIELGEIEAALGAQSGVTHAVVIAREDTPGDVRLVGYVTGAVDARTLKARLAESLPSHMVPAQIETIEAFPLTPNKKVDRNALPAPAQTRAGALAPAAPAATPKAQPETAAPRSDGDIADVEAQIAQIWQRILGVPTVSGMDNFFDLGGHSLLAVQAHRDIRTELGATLSITDIFRFPVLSALAAQVAETGGQSTQNPAPSKAAPVAPSSTAPNARADAMAKRRAMRAARVRR